MNTNALVTGLLVLSLLHAARGLAAPAHSGRAHAAAPAGAVPAALKSHPPAAQARPPAKPFIAPPPFVVAIDAGHGGKDTGAIGYNGAFEKDVVYAIALRLEGLVRAAPGMKAVMVRRGDVFIGLKERAEIARAAGADLFISVHADAHSDDAAKGSSVFVLSPRRVESGDFAESAAASKRAAGKVLRELGKRQPLHYRHVQKARFAVLKSPDMPSMLVETGFVSNPEEERQLTRPAYQEKVARAIFNGVRAYCRAARPAPAVAFKGKGMVLASGQ